MWYRSAEKQKEQKEDNPDYKLVSSLTENMIRNKLFFKGQYSPKINLVKKLTRRVIEKLQTKYNKIDLLRSKINDEQLTPLIKSIVDTMI
jgi:hypothetical protein